jgi:tetratricopeptide (TPR) repeat protein
LRGVALEPVGEPTWYLLHNNLGYCLVQMRRYAEAERWCRAAIAINPLRHNAHKNLGLACEGQGRTVDAALAFVQAVKREAGDPRALRHLRELVGAHPEIAAEIPNIAEQVGRCASAVEAAKGARAGKGFRAPPDRHPG